MKLKMAVGIILLSIDGLNEIIAKAANVVKVLLTIRAVSYINIA